MNELRVLFNSPLNKEDTETQTYGGRANNPDICGNNGLDGICAFAIPIEYVENHHERGKNNLKS